MTINPGKTIITVFILLLLVAGGNAVAGPRVISSDARIIPAPQMIKKLPGNFRLTRNIRLVVNDRAARDVAQYFQKFIRPATGYDLKILQAETPQKNAINLVIGNGIGSEEGYRLSVRSDEIVIRAATEKGLFYGLQSLRQMLPPEIESTYPINNIDWVIRAADIEDGPKYPYRGMHLDVSRHFFSKDFILRYIDFLALHKMNVFHWHLTDDQGWRIEIKKYPKLTSIGSYRPETVIGHPYDRVHFYDGKPVDGYYSQEDIREIVKYAAARQVTIVPEIDVPGHSSALLAAYPEYGCIDKEYKVKTEFHIFPDVICPTEKTFEFLEDIFAEVAELFPGPYIHVGGDEVMKEQWKACESCAVLMKKEGLKDYDELQSYFIRRLEKIILGLGKKMAGWEEILDGGINPGATVTVWLKREKIKQAIQAGHEVIVGMSDKLYFNQFESLSLDAPMSSSWQPPITLKDIYQYDIIPDGLMKNEASHILGAQGHVWGNFIKTPAQVEHAALPRMSALAEILWTPDDRRSWPDFLRRVDGLFDRLKVMDANVSKAIYKVTGKHHLVDGAMILTLNTEGKNHLIRYTIDGSKPTIHSLLYAGPLTLTKAATIRAMGQDPVSGEYFGDFRLTFIPHKALGKTIKFTREPRAWYQPGPYKVILDGAVAYDRIFHPTEWAEFFDGNMDGTIDFGKATEFHKVSLGFEPGKYRRLYAPQAVEIMVSDNGIDWKMVGKKERDDIRRAKPSLTILFPQVTARYLRIICKNNQKKFNSRLGKIVPVSIFIDEIVVQ